MRSILASAVLGLCLVAHGAAQAQTAGAGSTAAMKVALSNNYAGNSWRQAMLKSWTEVAGGKGTVAGVWGASLFLYLTNAMLNALGAGAGVRSIVYGVLIIAVVVASGRKARQ